MHDSYCLYSFSHSAMVEIGIILIYIILFCKILFLLLLCEPFIKFNNFLYVYGPCVCNKDILLSLIIYIILNTVVDGVISLVTCQLTSPKLSLMLDSVTRLTINIHREPPSGQVIIIIIIIIIYI